MAPTLQQRSSSSGSPRRDHRSGRMPRALAIAIAVAALAIVAVLTFVVLSQTSVFEITSINTQGTEHVPAETIAKLADVPEGTTLLNIDEALITSNIKRNPWIRSVKVIREFPDKLKIEVEERRIGAIVLMGSNAVAWNLGSDGVWIEPANVEVPEGGSTSEVALAKAAEYDALLITDVPSTVSPKAGEEATDASVSAVIDYMMGFSEDFRSKIMSFSASSEQSISCMLDSGVQISLGAPSDISVKERVINEILGEYPNQLTYINVRVPTKPSFRKVNTDSVQPGSGAVGGLDYDPSATGELQAELDASATEDGSTGEGTDGSAESGYNADGSYDDSGYYDENGVWQEGYLDEY